MGWQQRWQPSLADLCVQSPPVRGQRVGKEHLGDVGDSLIGHFVDQARRAGQPWSAIGASMGVTKQAAQKRFTAKADGDPFARFTPRARNVLVHAHDDAVRSQAESITPILLARHLLPDDQSLAVVALKQTGADVVGLRTVLGDPSPTETTLPANARTMIPYSNGSKKVLEKTGGNKYQAAHVLGIDRKTLYRKLAEIEGKPHSDA